MKRKNKEINIFSMSALDLFASALGAFILIAIIALPYYLKTDKKLIQEIKGLKEKIVQLTQDLEQSQANLAQSREETRQAQADLNQTQADLEQSQANLARSREETRQAQAALEQSQANLAKSKEETKQSQAELAKSREETKQAQKKNKQLQAELAKTSAVIVMVWRSAKPIDIDLWVHDPQGRKFYFSKKTHPGTTDKLYVDSIGVTKGIEAWATKQLKEGEYKVTYDYYSDRGKGNPSVNINGYIFTKNFTAELNTITLRAENQKKHAATITVDENFNATLQQH